MSDTRINVPASSEQKEVPKAGKWMLVPENSEIRGAGGLAVRDYKINGNEIQVGSPHMEEKVVRLPVGTRIYAEQILKDKDDNTWAVFTYDYHNPNQGSKKLQVCAMVTEAGWFKSKTYLEEAPAQVSTRDSLKALMDELPKA